MTNHFFVSATFRFPTLIRNIINLSQITFKLFCLELLMAFGQYWHYCVVGRHVPRIGKRIFNGGLVNSLQDWNCFEDTEMNVNII